MFDNQAMQNYYQHCFSFGPGVELSHVDIGGGLGVTYSTENPPSASEYLETVFTEIRNRNLELKVIVEPGRSVVANAGILVTRVLFLKVKK